jgi:hypothetical protein
VVIGNAAAGDTARVLAALRGRFRPRAITAVRGPAEAVPVPGRPRPLDALFAGRPGTSGGVTLHLCRGGTCLAATTGDAAVAAAAAYEVPAATDR